MYLPHHPTADSGVHQSWCRGERSIETSSAYSVCSLSYCQFFLLPGYSPESMGLVAAFVYFLTMFVFLPVPFLPWMPLVSWPWWGVTPASQAVTAHVLFPHDKVSLNFQTNNSKVVGTSLFSLVNPTFHDFDGICR